jgi:hypothetical protein
MYFSLNKSRETISLPSLPNWRRKRGSITRKSKFVG